MSIKFFAKGLKNYHWQSFFAKFFIIIFSLLSALVVIIFSMYSAFSYSAAKKDAFAAANQVISKTESTINRLMDETVSNYSRLTNQEDWQLFFFLPKEKIIENAALINNVKHDISICVSGNEQINSIYVCSAHNGYVISSSVSNSSADFSAFDDKGWCDFDKIPKQDILKSRTIIQNGTQKQVITFAKPFYYGNKLAGCYVVNFDAFAVNAAVSSGLSENYPCTLSVLNSFGDELCYVGDKALFEDFDPKAKDFSAVTAAPKIEMCKRCRLAGYAKIQNYQTNLSLCFEFTDPMGTNTLLAFLFSLAAVFFVSAVVAFLLTTKFYNIILNIMDILKFPDREDEVLSNNRKGFSAKLKALLSAGNYAEKELAQKINKFKHLHSVSLKSQLNPHFIYNVLHLISSYEMMEHKRDTNVTIAISLFSDLLRGVLDNKNTVVSLGEEIELSKKYLEIANMLVLNKFETVFDVSENLLNKKVLKLTLQPILENSVNHGLRRIKRKGYIKISACISNEMLVIKIRDNGCGMTAEELKNLQNSLNSSFEMRNTHLGLYNTNQRIRLVCGDEYGCSVCSDEGGTEVTVTLPDIG